MQSASSRHHQEGNSPLSAHHAGTAFKQGVALASGWSVKCARSMARMTASTSGERTTPKSAGIRSGRKSKVREGQRQRAGKECCTGGGGV